jgi:general secretion pathway protein D
MNTKPTSAARNHLRAGQTRYGLCIVIALLCCCATFQTKAQFPGFGGGNQGGGNQNRSRSSSTGQYPNNQVGDAVISVDQDRNLVVIADPDTTRYISEVVSNLNRPKPQVLIKVVFLEVTHNNSSDIGVEGSYTKGFGGTFSSIATNFMTVSNTIVPNIFTNTINSVFNSSQSLGLASSGASGLYQVLGQDYQVTLRAIAASGNAKVLSRPSVIARNNQPATITVGQSVPLINNVTFDQFGNQHNGISYQSVGIILRVTPFITPDGLVEMILSPETSELVADRSQWVPISTGAGGTISAPVINSRSADTVVVTPDGQTVIIGGLMSTSKADSETKIPFLGDIPILGNLFKHKVKNDAKIELLIFMTPHIIPAPAELAMVSDKDKVKSDAAKSLTTEEWDKFLDTVPPKEFDKDKDKEKSSKKRK